MKYKLFQIKDIRNTAYSFIGWCDSVAADFSIDDYKMVYSGKIEGNHPLAQLFEIFNIHHPEDFRGHSMSVSDVVALEDEIGGWRWFYCDSFGWEELTGKYGLD